MNKQHLEVFEKVIHRYENAKKMMFVKERLKSDLPPKGSAFYRYYSDPNKNPRSHYELSKEIDNMTLKECKNHPYWNQS